MLIELRDDAANRTFDDLAVVDGVDVLATNPVDDLGDERRGFDGGVDGNTHFRAGAERRPGHAAEREAESQDDARKEHEDTAESQCHSLLFFIHPKDATHLSKGREARATVGVMSRRASAPGRDPRMRIHGLAVMAQLEVQARPRLPARIADLRDRLAGLDPIAGLLE